MFDMRKHDTGCDYSDRVLEYVYKELDGEEIRRFEAHLGSCSACPDEVAAFTSVSGAVREWKAATFDAFEASGIWVEGSAPRIVGSDGDARIESLYGRVKAFFGAAPLMWQTASAIAALLLTAGIGWVYFGGDRAPTTAEKVPASKSRVENPVKNKPLLAANDETNGSSVSPVENDKTAPLEDPDPSATPLVAGNSKPLKQTERKIIGARSGKASKKKSTATPSNQNVPPNPGVRKLDDAAPKIERLTELANTDEAEDESLRLTELFAIAESDKR